MRQTLRAAQKEGFARIAVVCGAWHAPALAGLGPASKDAAILKGLPRIKVACTWVPWTYGRLTFESGYGAGVVSPGWYHHLWQARQKGLSTTDASIRWLTRVARLLRDEDYDVSSAHVIEAVRLAESLAAIRARPLPGLEEFGEATRSIFCFGDALPLAERKELKPGSCDGYHPEYTEAFDIAGLRAAVLLAEAAGEEKDAADWEQLAEELFHRYDERFGSRLPNDYGSYSVLWPCRLYAIDQGKAVDQFKKVGAQKPAGWRYFPLATAHQGLLAGNRQAGYATLEAHLAHEQMQGWYAFDEGGASGPGGWARLRTTWKQGVAMPHGWAVAEMWLLMRDCLVFEDGDRLILLGGVPEKWLTKAETIRVTDLPTHFGPCSFTYKADIGGAVLRLSGKAAPPGGLVLRLPPGAATRITIDGKEASPAANGDVPLLPATKAVRIPF
jgi:hypothetical protein